LDCRRRIVDNRQRFQISVVSLLRDFTIAEEIGNSLPHWNPFQHSLVFAGNLLSDFESLGIVNHHLHSNTRTVFVVHFQPVLFNAMLYPCPGKSSARGGRIGVNFQTIALSHSLLAQRTSPTSSLSESPGCVR